MAVWINIAQKKYPLTDFLFFLHYNVLLMKKSKIDDTNNEKSG